MARRDFYTSAAWQRCRDGYIKSVHGLCERCGKPGYIVHHKEHITDSNEDNPEITLNWANLEYLCLDCHNREHFAASPVRNDVTFDASGQLVPR
ncbi:MAG: HNH endonuclease [Cloacibacillus sp.]